jgi:ABC-type Zn2+ transport system substrate-binding protein/surface adhesin
MIGLGGVKVHTQKLNRPKKNPIAVPARVPNIIAVMMTGTALRVATIGPIGSEPRGVKQTIASIASSIANCVKKTVFLFTEAFI